MKNTKSVKIFSAIIVVVISITLIVLVFEFMKINTLKNRKNQLNKSLTNLEQQIEDYSDIINKYQNRENYVEEYARDVLNLVDKDEIWYFELTK